MEGRDDFLRRVAERNRDQPHQLEQRLEQARLVDLALHDEPDPALLGCEEQQRVNVGHVVAHQQGGPFERNIFRADDAQTINQPRDQHTEEAQEKVGKHPQGEHGQQKGEHADDHESFAGAEPEHLAKQVDKARGNQDADPAQEA